MQGDDLAKQWFVSRAEAPNGSSVKDSNHHLVWQDVEGPYAFSELQELFAQNKIEFTHWLWHPGLPEWIPAKIHPLLRTEAPALVDEKKEIFTSSVTRSHGEPLIVSKKIAPNTESLGATPGAILKPLDDRGLGAGFIKKMQKTLFAAILNRPYFALCIFLLSVFLVGIVFSFLPKNTVTNPEIAVGEEASDLNKERVAAWFLFQMGREPKNEIEWARAMILYLNEIENRNAVIGEIVAKSTEIFSPNYVRNSEQKKSKPLVEARQMLRPSYVLLMADEMKIDAPSQLHKITGGEGQMKENQASALAGPKKQEDKKPNKSKSFASFVLKENPDKLKRSELVVLRRKINDWPAANAAEQRLKSQWSSLIRDYTEESAPRSRDKLKKRLSALKLKTQNL